MELITNSRLSCFRRCPRAHRLRFVDLLTPVIDIAPKRDWGTVIHRALEYYWSHLSTDVNILADYGALIITDSDLDPFARSAALACWNGYIARWHATDCAAYRTLAVEAEFRTPLVNPDTGEASAMTLAGKMDGIVQDHDGKVYGLEHKCLAGDTPLFNHDTGIYETLAELCDAKRAPRVTAMRADGTMTVASAMVPVRQSPRAAYAVTTKSGRRLIASDNHPIWTPSGWTPAADLQKGGFVATVRHLAAPCNEFFSDEELRLIGYMIGDGSMTNMSLTKGDATVLNDAIRCAVSIGNAPPIINTPPDGRTTYIRFGLAGPVAKLMERVGLAGKLSAEKKVPNIQLSERQIGQIIGALWTTDGCIDIQRGRGYAKPRIIYTSRSKELCDGIRNLLQRIGIVSLVKETSVAYKGERVQVFTTQVVSRTSKRKFLKMAISGEISVIRSASPLAEILTAIPVSPIGDDSKMQPSLHEHIWWDRVESVSPIGEQVLYDLEVPDVHTFVADGIITHNTSGSDITPGSAYWQRLRIDSQISVYHDGAASLGHNLAGMIYDVIKRPTQKPYKATPVEDRKITKEGRLYKGQREHDEEPVEYALRIALAISAEPTAWFQRATVVRIGDEMLEARRDTWRQAQALALDYRNPDACFKFADPCEYFALCSGSAGEGDYVVGNKHPELTTV